jgi:4-hydroxy-tetrahydrodipicolinate synthase
MKAPRTSKEHHGVVVPMVTPITGDGLLDEPAVGRILDYMHQGGVQGVFVLGTTGEAPSVPLAVRNRLVELVADLAHDRMLVYAGISGNSLRDCVDAGNRYFEMGAAAVVAHVPAYFKVKPENHLLFFNNLADCLSGDLILYNMPLTTGVSIPMEVCVKLAEHPRVVGIKDSENDEARMTRLLKELGRKDGFSVFVGTGALMGKGLLQGADGIVPSVGNIAPRVCCDLLDSARKGDPAGVGRRQQRMMEISHLYQKGRTLGQSLAALKAAMNWMGLCSPEVFPPLQPIGATELQSLRKELVRLGLLVQDSIADEQETGHRTDDGRPGGSRTRTLSADSR